MRVNGPTTKQSIGLVAIFALMLGAGSLISKTEHTEAAPPGQPITVPGPTLPHTFSKPNAPHVWPASVPELIDRYNVAALKVNRSLLLPPAAALHQTNKQPTMRVLSHDVTPSTSVAIEVDQPSGKPTSLAVMAQPKTGAEAVQAMAVVAVMAAAVRGQPEDGQRLVKQCLLEKSSDTIKVGGIVFQCTALPGIIAAGVWPDGKP